MAYPNPPYPGYPTGGGYPAGPGYPTDGGYPGGPGYPPPGGGYPGAPGYPAPGYPAATGYPTAAPQQYYLIVSKLHGLVLDVERGQQAAGTRVMPWNKSGGDNQLWYDDPATGTIRTKLNGFVLDIEGDGSLRIMPYQPGDQNQQWERGQDGYIRNRVNRNKVLDIFNVDRSPGAKIGAWDANNGPNQQWTFEFVAAPTQPATYGGYPQPAPGGYPQGPGGYPAPGGYPQPSVQPMPPPAAQPVFQRQDFFIVSELNAKVLDVKGGAKTAGTPAIMWPRHTPNSVNQLWYTDQQGYIRSALNDFALDAAAGQRVHLQPFNGGANQQWVIDGRWIKNRANGQVLDIVGQNKHDGAELCSYQVNNQSNQHWRIERV